MNLENLNIMPHKFILDQGVGYTPPHGQYATCRHTALIDVSNYPADTEVPWFRSRVVCAKCGSGNKIDVRPNWKEQPPEPSLTGKQWR